MSRASWTFSGFQQKRVRRKAEGIVFFGRSLCQDLAGPWHLVRSTAHDEGPLSPLIAQPIVMCS